MNIRYRVTLTSDEREHLRGLLAGGSKRARTLKRAQLLLAANAGFSHESIATNLQWAPPPGAFALSGCPNDTEPAALSVQLWEGSCWGATCSSETRIATESDVWLLVRASSPAATRVSELRFESTDPDVLEFVALENWVFCEIEPGVRDLRMLQECDSPWGNPVYQSLRVRTHAAGEAALDVFDDSGVAPIASLAFESTVPTATEIEIGSTWDLCLFDCPAPERNTTRVDPTTPLDVSIRHGEAERITVHAIGDESDILYDDATSWESLDPSIVDFETVGGHTHSISNPTAIAHGASAGRTELIARRNGIVVARVSITVTE